MDEYSETLRRWRIPLTAAICVAQFLVGIIFVTNVSLAIILKVIHILDVNCNPAQREYHIYLSHARYLYNSSVSILTNSRSIMKAYFYIHSIFFILRIGVDSSH